MTAQRVSTRLLRRSSLANLAGSIGSSTLIFAATALLAAQLDEPAFDRYALAATMLVAASAVGTLGYPTLLNREAASARLTTSIWHDAHMMAALATITVVAALLVGYWKNLDGPIDAALTIVGALAMAATTLDVAVARGALSIPAATVGALVRGVSFALFAVGLALMAAPTAPVALGALALATVFGALTTTSLLRRRWVPSANETGLTRRAARITSLKMAPISITIVLSRRIDVFLITALITQTGAIGAFFLASRIAEILAYVPSAVNSFGGTDIAASASTQRALATSLRRQASLTTRAVVPATVVLAVGGIVLFDVLAIVTPNAKTTLLVLLGSQVISALAGPVGLIHTMTGHEATASWASVAALLATVVIGIPLIATFGIVGAGIGAFTTTLGWNLWLWISAYRTFGVRSGTAGLVWPSP